MRNRSATVLLYAMNSPRLPLRLWRYLDTTTGTLQVVYGRRRANVGICLVLASLILNVLLAVAWVVQ